MNVHGNESAPVAVGAARGKLADGAAASRVSTPQMRRQILLLASAQALFQAVSVAVTTVGSLAGSQLASSPSWATAPVATMFLGTALATAPASMGMARIGRRAGFLIGSGLGVLGGLVGASGVYAGSLLLLCLGTLLVGA